RSVAVVHAGDEVRIVVVLFAVNRVRETEPGLPVVLYIRHNLFHLLERLSHFLLPAIGIADYVGDMTLPAGRVHGPRRVKSHVLGAHRPLVGRENWFEESLPGLVLWRNAAVD